MGQQRVSNIALIHIERAYANFVLENDIERIIDIFGSRTGRDSYFFYFDWIALRVCWFLFSCIYS